MDKCFGCHDSRVSIDFSADSEAVNLAIGYAEETDTAAMLDAMLTIFFIVCYFSVFSYSTKGLPSA